MLARSVMLAASPRAGPTAPPTRPARPPPSPLARRLAAAVDDLRDQGLGLVAADDPALGLAHDLVRDAKAGEVARDAEAALLHAMAHPSFVPLAAIRPDLLYFFQGIGVNLLEGYGLSARRLRGAGLDGLEIVASHGYLPAQFLNPRSNRREDGYGGSAGHRQRFLLELVDAVALVGPKARIKDRLQLWLDSDVTTMNLQLPTLETVRFMAECVL